VKNGTSHPSFTVARNTPHLAVSVQRISFCFYFVVVIIIIIIIIALNKYYFPAQVPSHVLMGIPHGASFSPLSPLGEACSRRDLTAMQEVLEKVGYKDDEGVANEVLYIFQMIMNH
jgi:hypothetical protein